MRIKRKLHNHCIKKGREGKEKEAIRLPFFILLTHKKIRGFVVVEPLRTLLVRIFCIPLIKKVFFCLVVSFKWSDHKKDCVSSLMEGVNIPKSYGPVRKREGGGSNPSPQLKCVFLEKSKMLQNVLKRKNILMNIFAKYVWTCFMFTTLRTGP